jgi:hypothetical protein
MTSKLIRFSLYKSLGSEGLKLRKTQSIQSTRAIAGMEAVFKSLREINAEAYGKVRSLDEFTVTLTPLPGSENYSLQIRSNKLQINIGKLKPETKAPFLASLETQSLSKTISGPNPALSLDPDTISSMGPPSSFLKDLLVPWTMIVSTFRKWVNSFLKLFSKDRPAKPDIVEKPSEKEVPSPSKTNLSLPVEPASTDVFYDLEDPSTHKNTLDIDQKKEARIQRRIEKAKKTAKQAPVPKPVARSPSPAAVFTIPDLPPEVLHYEKLVPLSDEQLQAKPARSILLESSPSEIKAADAAQEDEDFVALGGAGTPPPSDPIINAPSKPPLEIALRSLFLAQFSSTEVQSRSAKQLFGFYLLDQVFPPIQSCEMDLTTGRFKLTFVQEKQIPLTELPSGKSEQTLKKLSLAKGTTLHIAKELTGRFKSDEGKLEFDEGALTIQWKKWAIRCTTALTQHPTPSTRFPMVIV